jgi:hypothetical protein
MVREKRKEREKSLLFFAAPVVFILLKRHSRLKPLLQVAVINDPSATDR